MNLINRRERLIYLAAIIDGEGSIGIELLSPCKITRKGKESWQRKKDYYVARLCVINTDERLMEWIHTNFGGSVNTRSRIAHHKKCFRWHIFGKALEDLLVELVPFIFMKKQQALTLLDYRKTVGKTGWLISDEILATRKELWLKCKRLNKMGS